MVNSKTRVFLSYGRKDDITFVQKLRDDLVTAGFESVWFDEQSLQSRGLSFHQEIKDAIRTNVDRVVYVCGPAAAQSAYVREEWQLALLLDHVVVTPILRRGDYHDLPGELGLIHCRDFRDNDTYEKAFALLVEDLLQPNPKLGPLFSVPHVPTNFIARPDLIHRICDAILVDLRNPHTVPSAEARVGIHGMGGIGKSVVAAAIAHNRQVRQSFPDGLAWITFGAHLSTDELLRRQQNIVVHFGGDPAFDSVDQGKGVLRALLQKKAILLVLDDVCESADVLVFDDLGPRCRTLITTRDAGILHTLQGKVIPVALLTEAESLQLLADTIAVSIADLSGDAIAVVKECGRLPVALALTGGMIKKRGGEFASVLKLLRKADIGRIADRHSLNSQHRDLWRVMHTSVEILDDDSQRRFAELSVFAGSRTVPEATVATLWGHTGKLDALATEALLIEFDERSLIQLSVRGGDGGQMRRSFLLHDLLYDYAKSIAGDERTLHRSLLDSYRNLCHEGWQSGPDSDDGYYFLNLLYHLHNATMDDEISQLLFDMKWFKSKIEFSGLPSLLSDFEYSDDEDAALVRDALRLSVRAINRGTSELWTQLQSRLLNATHPRIRRMLDVDNETWRISSCHPILQQAGETRLITSPDSRSKIAPNSDNEIITVAITSDGSFAASSSLWGGSVRIWDFESGVKIDELIDQNGEKINIEFIDDGVCVVVTSDDDQESSIEVWNRSTNTRRCISDPATDYFFHQHCSLTKRRLPRQCTAA